MEFRLTKDHHITTVSLFCFFVLFLLFCFVLFVFFFQKLFSTQTHHNKKRPNKDDNDWILINMNYRQYCFQTRGSPWNILTNTDTDMSSLRQALNSPKLKPCFTLLIFSFMVSFTLSILVLTMGLKYLRLPVLIMWLITTLAVFLTVCFWCCEQSTVFQSRLKENSKASVQNKDTEDIFLSQRKGKGQTDKQFKTYGTKSTTETHLTK